MSSDAELLHRYAAEHSEGAFAELVRRHVHLVYFAALRQVGGDAHLAQDVAQGVFTDLARKARALAGREVLASWLHTSTRFAAAKARRSAQRREKHEQAAELMHALERDPARRDWENLQPLIDDLVHALDERDRAAVLLRYFENRPFAEIGATLGVSEDAARMRTERALDKLRTRLARRGIVSTSAALIFMNTGKIVVSLAAAGALAGLGFGVYQKNEAQAAAAAVAQADQDRATLTARLREAQSRATRAEQSARDLTARVAAIEKAGGVRAAGPAAGTGAKPGASADNVDVKAAAAKITELQKGIADKLTVMANPEVQRARIEMERAGLGLRFASLYQTLGLAPDQIARFEARVLEAIQGSMDLLGAAQAQGLSPNDPALNPLAAQSRTALENDLRALLGEAGFQEYQRFERTAPAREVVNGAMAHFTNAGAALSTAQAAQLGAAVAAASPAGGKAARAADVNWPDVIARAQAFLSPAQMNVLRSVEAQARTTAQAQQITETVLRPKAARPPGS